MSDDERRDIKATLAGDGEAYARLIRRYQDRVARRMWRFTRDPLELESLVQTVFVEAYKSLGGFRGTGPLEHWLLRIATRVGYRFWKQRDRRRGREVSLGEYDPPGDVPDEPSGAADRLHAMLARLKPRDRLVLTLMYFEDSSIAAIAEQTGWSESMVKVQLHRARKRLKSLLDNATSGRNNTQR
ncbi:MAG: RNA polymerase sigma factor [Phycisphaerae bacterium]|nr:RNA polymerase sigma factor [Phycisphaerae bacterium]